MTEMRPLHVAADALDLPDPRASGVADTEQRPRILILHGSLRPQSFSRKLALEAEQLLQPFGAQTRVFQGAGLLASPATTG